MPSLSSFASTNTVSNICLCIAAVLQPYDWLLNFSDEVEYVWNSSFNITTTMYILTRIMPFGPIIMEMMQMTGWNKNPQLVVASTWMIFLGVNVTEGILIMRTYAIWKCNKKVLFGLIALLSIGMLASGMALIFLSLPGYRKFGILKGGDYGYLAFSTILMVELAVFVLTVWRGIRDLRSPRNTLVISLYRNGVLFFVYIIMISFLNMFITTLVVKQIVENSIPLLQFTLHSILSTRVVLDLRRQRRSMDTYESYLLQGSFSGNSKRPSQASACSLPSEGSNDSEAQFLDISMDSYWE